MSGVKINSHRVPESEKVSDIIRPPDVDPESKKLNSGVKIDNEWNKVY